eukprot:13662524-Ditylum_brightwellii.AAC.1
MARAMVLLRKASNAVAMTSNAVVTPDMRDTKSHEEGNPKSFALQYYLHCPPIKQWHTLMAIAEGFTYKELNNNRGVLKT